MIKFDDREQINPEEQLIIDDINTCACHKLQKVQRIIWEEEQWGGTIQIKRQKGFIVVNGHITALGLYNCHIEELPESIGKLKYLKILDLGRNKLFEVPKSIGNLESLRILNLHKNKIVNIPESIGNLQNLQDLNLGGNQLGSIPYSITKLKKLKKLYLYSNLIRFLPEEFGKLQNLVELNLDSNLLTRFPNSFHELINLEILRVWGNQISELPENFGNLESLHTLLLGQNLLTHLPESVGKLTNLEEINLWKNKLRILPTSMKYLQNLKKIDIKGNDLEDKPEFISYLINLEELSIDGHLLKQKPKSLQYLEKDEIGTFILKSGEITVTDPWMGINPAAVFRSLNGEWRTFYIYGALVAVHSKYLHRMLIPDDWNTAQVGVNMELCGIYDSDIFPEEDRERELNKIYDENEELLSKFECNIYLNKGVVSRTENEHGLYPVYYYTNDKNYVVAIWVDFHGGEHFNDFMNPRTEFD